MKAGRFFISTGFYRPDAGHLLFALHRRWRFDYVRPAAKPDYRRLYIGPLEIEWSNPANTAIAFGLEAQGHIPAVEAALAEGADWQEIGRRIGWDGDTAKTYYERHLARTAKASSGTSIRQGGGE